MSDNSRTRDASTIRKATELVELLMDGPKDIYQLQEGLGAGFYATRVYLRVARNDVAPQHGLAIPRPTAGDGYLYRVTGQWIDPDDPAIIDGVRASIDDGLTRLDSIVRDYEVAEGTTDGRSREGKRVRAHLDILRGARATVAAVDEQLAPAGNGA
jgi:hypothetical protein